LDTKYLQKRGHQWWVRVTVPRTLTHLLGTHLRESLHTSDLKVANSRKFQVLAVLKDRITKARNEPSSKISNEAAMWRQSIRDAYKREDPDLAETLEILVGEEAERLEQKQGFKVAKAFHDAAVSVDPVLSEIAEDWLNATSTKESTRLKRRKAYEGLRDFLGHDIPPESLTDEQVRDYADSLKRSKLAPNTIRDKLSALGGLWAYMAERLIIPRGTNPWKGFTIQGGSTEACRAFSQAEILTLLGAKFPQPWHKDVFICLLLTGARPQELCGLMHSDVDLTEKRISIASSKTGAGIRNLPIEHPVLLSILSKYTKKGNSGFIFPVKPGGADKSPAANYGKMFGRVKTALGLPSAAQLYSARKSFITTALDLGLPPVEIERYVGHEVGRLILTVYSQGRGEKGLREVAKGFRYREAVEEALTALAV
jgi:integrase